MNAPTKLLTRAEASTYLRDNFGVIRTVQTLAAYATRGGGPAYRLFGRKPMYAPVDLDAWADEKFSRVVRSTSEYGAAA